jgi:hypothetical protein
MTEDQLFEICCIIDNGYREKRKSFKAEKVRSCWHLTTNVCDSTYLIRIWERNNKISSIGILGDDTDDWTSITDASWTRIEKFLEQQNIERAPS